MSEQKLYPPREGDLPRDELVLRAKKVLEDWPDGTEIHFKFTCQYCGERCTLVEPNLLYENGECFKCGKSTPITVGGFAIHHVSKPHHEKEN